MPGADTQYNEVVLAEKLIDLNKLISEFKYKKKNLTIDSLGELIKQFEELVPHRLVYYDCEKEVLDNFSKITEILNYIDEQWPN